MACRTVRLIAPAVLALLASGGSAIAHRAASHREMLPARRLDCQLGRVTNFDPKREQTAAELRYDGIHAFSLFLPAIPKRTTQPPDATDKPEPVDPRTRILADPDHIARHLREGFDRVVDLWPERVEMTQTISGALMNVIVIAPIDAAAGTANIVMSRASELTHLDPDHLYQGSCRVIAGPAASAARGPAG